MTSSFEGLGPLALSDLARAVAEASAHSKPQMRFSVNHIADEPGFLFATLAGGVPGEMSAVSQTLSSSANGVGLVVLTEHDIQGSARSSPGAPLVGPVNLHESTGAKFSSYARPNPSFLYDGSSVLEGLIVIEDEPRALTYAHAIALRELAEFIATLASVEAKSPILSLQSPAQAPPHTSDKSDIWERHDEWPRSACFSLRFSIALRGGASSQRFALIDRIGAHCRELGYGFWAADTRGGYRQGVWFGLSQHDRLAARRSHPTIADRGGDRKVNCVVPITVVGPARVGSTAAILSYLSRFPEVGVAACSITALDDLAFIHLQLVMNRSARRKLAAKNEELANVLAELDGDPTEGGGLTPRNFFRRYGPLLTADAIRGPERPEVVSALDERCGDYQVLAGPVLETVPEGEKRLPVWAAWYVRDVDAGLSAVLHCLENVVKSVGLMDGDKLLLNIEYAISRASRDGSLHGKAKMSIAEQSVPPWALTQERRDRARLFCGELEQRWRAALLEEDVAAEVTVSDREFRIGRWSRWL